MRVHRTHVNQYLKQGFWGKVYIYIRGLHSVQSGVLPVYYSGHAAIYSKRKKYNSIFSFFLKEIKELPSA
jgi:hypothetical protein